MRNLPPERRRWARVRVGFLAVLLLTGAGLVIRRAFELTVERGDTLREMAEEQYLRDIRLSPKRGTIYDRHGAELAVSVEVDSVWANPRELRAAGMDPVAAAARLATVLRINQERIITRLSSDRYFVWIERRITPQQAAAVRSLEVPGVHMEQEARRYYPNRQLAAHVIGFANIDGVGIEGLELSQEEHLRGSVRAVPAIRDRRGRVVFSEQLLDDRAARGDDVHLTIDKSIQHIAERELELAARTFEARAGSVVVMDPHTGEILAVANYPTFNPNQPGRADPGSRRNRAVTDRFEPGSTVKPFTVAGALAAGTVRSNQVFDCEGGAMQIAEYTIHDSHRFDELSTAQIIAFSSNIGAAKIGATMGRRGLFRTFRRFGFGEVTGLPLPGETGGILRHHRRWYEMDAATIAFGQGVSVTNIQMASAMSAIANGGLLMRPVLVRRVSDGLGETVDETMPTTRRRVVPRDTARIVGDMMTPVTGPGGTGTAAAIDGYLVAGKTGTAQKADYVGGGYSDDRWTASFVGFVPAEDPRLVISVVIDEPIIAHSGGAVAGPVFRRVGEAALRHLGVPAASGGDALTAHATERRRREREAVRETREQARAGRRRGTQESGESGVEVALVDDAEPSPAITERMPTEGETRVPDVVGQSARGALTSLHAAGLRVELRGSGVVETQVPEAGGVVGRGTEVRVVLAPPTHALPPVATEPSPGELAAAVVPGGAR
ncbi:MAG: transpeptidase family protein [Deltaproteobacteria bacterium]|nr:transpeptidase family protein [Deltaproteobacteria bacterium]